MRLSQKYFHARNSQGVSEVFKCKALRLRERERTKVRDRARISKATQQFGAYETPSFYCFSVRYLQNLTGKCCRCSLGLILSLIAIDLK